MSLRLEMPRRARQTESYDVVVVGAGPAGLSAALYSARLGLKTACVSEDVGGTLNEAGEIDDYLGFQSTLGPDLAKRFEEHVRKYGVPIFRELVVDVVRERGSFKVVTRSGSVFTAKAVILAVGSKRRRLGVPGEAEFANKGVSYCAPCDAPLFKGKVVAVVGGGNAALQSALLLTSYAAKIYLIHRRGSFRAYDTYIRSVTTNPKIELVMNSVVEEIGGDRSVKWVRVKDVITGESRKLDVEGVLVEVGSEPPKDFLSKAGVELDEHGYVIVEPGQRTSVEGLFAAGDCTGGPHKKKFDQIITAAAEGALAALSAYEYLIKAKLDEERGY
ncbi:MAG: FAD-dependent oxidoreductase [Zestosphaera sp.]